jgi:hypothetical protein
MARPATTGKAAAKATKGGKGTKRIRKIEKEAIQVRSVFCHTRSR